jgi:cytochrome c-type biogenesis protein CcmH/NrfG
MNAEEQLNKLKQIPPLSKEDKRKRLVTAMVLALATLLSVLFLLVAFVQKQVADKSRVEAENQRMEAERQAELAQQSRIAAEHAQLQARQQLEQALAELENCKKEKR